MKLVWKSKTSLETENQFGDEKPAWRIKTSLTRSQSLNFKNHLVSHQARGEED